MIYDMIYHKLITISKWKNGYGYCINKEQWLQCCLLYCRSCWNHGIHIVRVFLFSWFHFPIYKNASSVFPLTFSRPEGCERRSCDYHVAMGVNEYDVNYLDIYMEANAQGWVAIGFSLDIPMVSICGLFIKRIVLGFCWYLTWNFWEVEFSEDMIR